MKLVTLTAKSGTVSPDRDSDRQSADTFVGFCEPDDGTWWRLRNQDRDSQLRRRVGRGSRDAQEQLLLGHRPRDRQCRFWKIVGDVYSQDRRRRDSDHRHDHRRPELRFQDRDPNDHRAVPQVPNRVADIGKW